MPKTSVNEHHNALPWKYDVSLAPDAIYEADVFAKPQPSPVKGRSGHNLGEGASASVALH